MDFKKYIDFKKGAIPLLFSVPHAGTLSWENIPERSSGVLGIDKNANKLALELVDYITLCSKKKTSTQKSPSYVISKVRRNKIDLNRPESEAFDANSSLAREIYRFYHDKIKEFISKNLNSFGRSLLLDIHGFEKDKRPQGFRDVELILGTNNFKSLFPERVPKREWNNNIRGKIIRKFLESDVPIAPGHPRRREYVLTGGYIVQTYGAAKIPGSQAFQIEFSDKVRLYDRNLRIKVLKILAELLAKELV